VLCFFFVVWCGVVVGFFFCFINKWGGGGV